jgi:hypothetical protein
MGSAATSNSAPSLQNFSGRPDMGRVAGSALHKWSLQTKTNPAKINPTKTIKIIAFLSNSSN